MTLLERFETKYTKEVLMKDEFGIDFLTLSRIHELARWACERAEEEDVKLSGYWARRAAHAAFMARPDLRWPDDVRYGQQLTLADPLGGAA
jgi:hypothetical protein